MKYDIDIIKGIHPGIIIDRDLQKRHLTKVAFAEMIGDYPSRITEIVKGRRKLNLPLSLKIEQALGYQTGFLMTLQLHYEIKRLAETNTAKPDLSKFTPSLFWDTTIDKIDWQRHKRAVIERVMSRGNEEQKEEIRRFYGDSEIEKYARPVNAYRIAYLTDQNRKPHDSGL